VECYDRYTPFVRFGTDSSAGGADDAVMEFTTIPEEEVMKKG